MTKFTDPPRPLASPPCFAHELEYGEYGAMGVDMQTTIEVNRWRSAKRKELIAARLAIPVKDRQKHALQISQELDQVLDVKEDTIVSVYWPIKGEINLRPWMQQVAHKGCKVALPVVVAKNQPLIFRLWTPDTKMERGIWNIPIPAEGDPVTPTVVISPLVGFDPNCYRLGYGGGFYDRTLASFSSRPYVIGVGHPSGALETIFPQPYDIPMDIILTGGA